MYRPFLRPGIVSVVLLLHALNATSPAHAVGAAAMTVEDRRLAGRAVQRALETKLSGISVRWNNDASGNAGSVTPVRTYRTTGGRYCRVYEERLFRRDVLSDGRQKTACRGDRGTWRDIPQK